MAWTRNALHRNERRYPHLDAGTGCQRGQHPSGEPDGRGDLGPVRLATRLAAKPRLDGQHGVAGGLRIDPPAHGPPRIDRWTARAATAPASFIAR